MDENDEEEEENQRKSIQDLADAIKDAWRHVPQPAPAQPDDGARQVGVIV